MGPIRFLVLLSLLLIQAEIIPPPNRRAAATVETQSVQAPVLKWQKGGCFASWCETGWYSSPAVADLDRDGRPEVIGSGYSIVVLDGETGELAWRVSSGHDRTEPGAGNVGRTWPGVAVADIDGDGELEIATAHGGGYISVYNHLGYFESGWPQHPVSSELRGLAVFDVEDDGTMEVLATAAVPDQINAWLFEHNGVVRAGWPQLSNDSGYAWGVYNDNAAAGDVDGDGFAEIIIPSDVHYINAYEENGSQIPAHPIYGGKGWGKVGVWESLETELRGWGTCSASDDRSERYRANFAHGAGVMADLNADGVNEVIVTGNVYDCIPGYPSQYTGVYIFHADRKRFDASGFNWDAAPYDTGAPLSEDYNLIENAQPNPVITDLDGDGNKEILYASYDGRVHAFWLDKSEHGGWPFAVYNPAQGFYTFASEPVVADLDNNGTAEVIFASWVQKGTGQSGSLYVLDYLGNQIHQVGIPPAFGSADWNGALAAPTLADIDGDPDLELVLNSAHSGLLAYDLPATAEARVLWTTGRGSFRRDGYLKTEVIVSYEHQAFLPLMRRD